MDSSSTITTLFLNENPVPPIITQGTIPIREQRLRAALDEVKTIHILARPGKDSLTRPNSLITPLEAKMVVHHTPPWPYYGASIPLFLYGIFMVLRYRPTLIEAESPILSGPAAILLGKIFHLPVVVEYRAPYYNLIRHRFPWIPYAVKKVCLAIVFNWTVRQADFCIANSKLFARELVALGAHTLTINPGLYPRPPKPQTKKLTRPLRLGYLGRLVPEKGVATLIKAMAILNQNHVVEATLEIAGSGPLRSSLHELVTKLHLTSIIKFVGVVDPYQALSRWHIMVNPCLVSPPLEMANAEAASQGVPVVCFGNQKTPETVSHNYTGFKVKTTTPAALARALSNLAARQSLYTKMSRQAPKFARSNYSFDGQVRKLRRLYHQLNLL